jgi:hypothetical protein
MPGLQDNLRRWRENAEIDWFSQFIKAWIPFNAWMTDAFGDQSDRDLLDRVKSGQNVVYNRLVPMLTRSQSQVPGGQDQWQDDGPEALDLRFNIAELHRLLQSCVVDGRRGRISFETVDIGANSLKDETRTRRTRAYRVQRDVPDKGNVTLEIAASASVPAFALVLSDHDRRSLEDDASFKALIAEQRSMLLDMFESVAPRRIVTVVAAASDTGAVQIGDAWFTEDPHKLFSAVLDIVYGLRNALFHGSITPNGVHNQIYEPAFKIVMRMVHATI